MTWAVIGRSGRWWRARCTSHATPARLMTRALMMNAASRVRVICDAAPEPIRFAAMMRQVRAAAAAGGCPTRAEGPARSKTIRPGCSSAMGAAEALVEIKLQFEAGHAGP